MPMPVAAPSKELSEELAGIMGSNPAGDMDVSHLWMLCILCCQVEVSA